MWLLILAIQFNRIFPLKLYMNEILCGLYWPLAISSIENNWSLLLKENTKTCDFQFQKQMQHCLYGNLSQFNESYDTGFDEILFVASYYFVVMFVSWFKSEEKKCIWKKSTSADSSSKPFLNTTIWCVVFFSLYKTSNWFITFCFA